MTAPAEQRVVLGHDYLNQRGGAERVALALSDAWPQAPLYTSIYRPTSTFPDFLGRDVRTSYLNQLPIDASFRSLLPLYPRAFDRLGPVDADVLLTSSSGWAHGIPATPSTARVVYCHTPARWLYRPEQHLGAASWQRRISVPLLRRLRRWDLAAAAGVDVFIANSENVAHRIAATYGREAMVIYPPVETARFSPSQRGERLLVVSRLIDYKRVDAVVTTANLRGFGLDVIGAGPQLAALRAIAGPTVRFLGPLPDRDVTAAMEQCRALVLPGEEDFGITPVEAMAAGKPVIAFAAGGALETVRDGVTGTFFSDHTPQSIGDAVERADSLPTAPEVLAAEADRFGTERFAREIREVVAAARPTKRNSSSLAR